MEDRTLQEDQELNDIQTRIGLRWLWCVALAIALFCAMRRGLSVDYYILVRIAACASFAIWALAAHAKGMTGWRNLFVVVALLYNPFFPIRLESTWPLLYLLTGGLALVPGVLGHLRLPALRTGREVEAERRMDQVAEL